MLAKKFCNFSNINDALRLSWATACRSNEEAAKALQVSVSTLKNWKSGRVAAPIHVLWLLWHESHDGRHQQWCDLDFELKSAYSTISILRRQNDALRLEAEALRNDLQQAKAALADAISGRVQHWPLAANDSFMADSTRRTTTADPGQPPRWIPPVWRC